MKFREDLPFWQVPLTDFQVFDRGETITCTVPSSWNLLVGELFEYEAGHGICGLAEVVSIEPGEATAWTDSGDGEGVEVPGTTYKLKRNC
jgi:hypothetical protein